MSLQEIRIKQKTSACFASGEAMTFLQSDHCMDHTVFFICSAFFAPEYFSFLNLQHVL